MNIGEILRISWEAIGKNKVRSLLTMLGIIIGVAAVIMAIAVSNGTAATIRDQITSLGSNLIFITPNFTRNGPQGGPDTGGLVFTDAAAIQQQVPNVAGVSVEQGTTETVKAGAVSLSSIAILGSLPDFPTVRGMKVANGSYFSPVGPGSQDQGGGIGLRPGAAIIRDGGSDRADRTGGKFLPGCDRGDGPQRHGG